MNQGGEQVHEEGQSHLAEAVEAAARMLPATVPQGGEYVVARTVLGAAMPHLVKHLGGRKFEELRAAILGLHVAGPADHDGLRTCSECMTAWPCPTVRCCPAPAAAGNAEAEG